MDALIKMLPVPERRNGPNPAFPPVGGYHWFDGDGEFHLL